MNPINPATSRIQISGIRQFSDLVSQYPDALSLTIGQPHFPTPSHIKEAAIKAILDGQTTYTPNRGLPALRKAAATYYSRLCGLSYDPQTEILVTVGATHALDITLSALLEPGDEVLIPAPAYPGYEPIVWLAGATPIYIDTRKDDFKLTPELLRENVTGRTKVIVIASPANPTGVAYSPAELDALAEAIRGTKAYVVTDELYTELRFDGVRDSLATRPAMRERTVVIHGLSKSHSMTGWRIGFTFAPEQITGAMVKILQYSVSCASSVSQYAALEALTNGSDDAGPMRDHYRKNADLTVAAFRELGLPIVPPQGTFYAFPSIEPLGLTSQTFARRLLDEGRVAVVPGDAFSAMGEGYVRLSFACEEEKLRDGLSRIAEFVRSIRK
ncbi:aminotransferase class I/II-fold pyridoxal phosphate-dependent enzyme [Alicyclobacillus dauci]|uniref:Aminotransferase n=1 Tax=Alicyclobacillus dauci TaxID=1475485 RepID=A0ABY6Z9E4_9BACL|nr:aminotransferase class I/II-fold pyridoxal phosphate-dependent enzyme [Alicyclobacillus dauci]WAH39325.1 aminotransferase class I/II-fold pyridoxal phosphate-dependent enzyme [Alicyclobacillus dauci]